MAAENETRKFSLAQLEEMSRIESDLMRCIRRWSAHMLGSPELDAEIAIARDLIDRYAKVREPANV